MHSFSCGHILIAFLSLYCPPAEGSSKPWPFSVPPGRWIGYDGVWSSVSIQVGTPPQELNVFPNTRSSESFVIGRSGCNENYWCDSSRGNLFFHNNSSTWEYFGSYRAGYILQLGEEGIADYGGDIIMADTVKVPELALGIVNTTAWWIGTLGLGLAVQQFEENTSLSFLTSLVNHSITPSHSYGYTAGAYYRVKRVPSSLTFGGVDKTRFVENDVKFRLTDDNLPVLSIKSINMTTAPGKLPPSPVQKDYHYVSLNSDAPELYTIDSSTPYFWFPEHLCNSIAEYLQLTYNETIGLYTYGNNPSAFDSILSSNLTFTFNLVDNVGSSPVSISLPFRAFDHTLTYPFPNTYLAQEGPGIRYFPMKKTNNSAQYTIGRVFLQEAYLMVDYERSIFSVSQAKFPSDPQLEPEILPIYLPSTGLPMKFKVAIGIGVGIVIAMAISILVLLRYRRNRRRQIEDNENEKGGYRPRFRLWGSKKKETSGNKKQKFRKLVELPNNCPPPVEVPGDSPVGDIVAELPLSPVLVELEASERINGKPRGVRTANQIPLPQYEEVDSKIDAVDSDNLHLIHPAFRSPDPARIVVKHGQNEVSQDDRRPIHGTKPKSKQIRTKPHPIFTAARGTSS